MKKKNILRAVVALSLSLGLGLSLGACTFNNKYGLPYQPATQQGNWITQKQVSQLKKGFTKQQIIYLLGTPLNTNLYGDAEWFYSYLYQVPFEAPVQRIFVLKFASDGTLDTWCGSEQPDFQPFTASEADQLIKGGGIECPKPAVVKPDAPKPDAPKPAQKKQAKSPVKHK